MRRAFCEMAVAMDTAVGNITQAFKQAGKRAYTLSLPLLPAHSPPPLSHLLPLAPLCFYDPNEVTSLRNDDLDDQQW